MKEMNKSEQAEKKHGILPAQHNSMSAEELAKLEIMFLEKFSGWSMKGLRMSMNSGLVKKALDEDTVIEEIKTGKQNVESDSIAA